MNEDRLAELAAMESRLIGLNHNGCWDTTLHKVRYELDCLRQIRNLKARLARQEENMGWSTESTYDRDWKKSVRDTKRSIRGYESLLKRTPR